MVILFFEEQSLVFGCFFKENKIKNLECGFQT